MMKRSKALAGLTLLLLWPGGRSYGLPQEPATQSPSPAAAPPTIVVPEGTPLALVLQTAISTRTVRPGQAVFLEVLSPVVVEDRIAIPAGSFVHGTLVEVRRRGRFKGREVLLRLDRLILPNGYSIGLDTAATNTSTGGNESVMQNGKIKSGSGRLSATGTVLGGAALGAMLGTAITFGGSGKAMAIGAGAGAGIALLAVLAARNRHVELPRGATIEVTLKQPLHLDAARANFTDIGRATALPPPPDRRPKPERPRFPFFWP